MIAGKAKGDSCESPLPCAPQSGAASGYKGVSELLTGVGSRGGGGSRRFRSAEIAGRRSLRHLVDHEFQRRPAAPGIEENGLVDGAVFLLEGLVVGQDVDGELVLLGVGAFELDFDAPDFLRGSLAVDGELEIVASAHAAKLIDLVVVAGDQGAHF